MFGAVITFALALQKALLAGGWMSHRTPEHRLRVKVTKASNLIDLTIQGQLQ